MLNPMVLVFCLAGLLLQNEGARADATLLPGQMSADGIARLAGGTTFQGIYFDGQPWWETLFVGGRLDYADDFESSAGDWSVQGDTLCTFYDRPIAGGCFALIQRSANCIDFYAVAADGTLAYSTRDEWVAGTGWTARGADASRPSTCDDGLTS